MCCNYFQRISLFAFSSFLLNTTQFESKFQAKFKVFTIAVDVPIVFMFKIVPVMMLLRKKIRNIEVFVITPTVF